MHRTNIYLTDAQHQAIGQIAASRGVARAEVIRGFIDEKLGSSTRQERRAAVEAAFGLWAERSDDEINELKSFRTRDRASDHSNISEGAA
jgi:hypothetical protein